MLKKAFQILTESSSSSHDPYLTYGQHIANELRKYDQRTLVFVKQAINNVIFEADLGKYTHYGGFYTQNYGQTSYGTSQSSTSSSSSQPPLPSPQLPVSSSQPSLSSPQPPIPSPQISPCAPLTLVPQPTIQPTIDESYESEADRLIEAIHSFSA